ncbi:MAG: mechanosensitive ion channel family protein [Sciscionella sp.]|nr:mechanosensitive ion channel family protein [Sciscionella sp.]
MISTPIHIVVILLIAIIVRLLARRLIDRLTTVNGNGKLPSMLRPLKEKAPIGPLITERRRQRAKTVGSLLKSLTSVWVFGVAIILILNELGINLAPILASAGVVGVALGFGAQNLVRDFLSGIFMMLEDQYGVGDVIDVGSASGTVEAIGLRVTTLRDIGGTVWYVRNGEVTSVGNSSQDYAVAVVDLMVSGHADVPKVLAIAGEVAAREAEQPPLDADVLAPPQVLGVEKITAEGITVRLTARVRAGRQWATQRALRAKIMVAFDDAGIEPPASRPSPPPQLPAS